MAGLLMAPWMLMGLLCASPARAEEPAGLHASVAAGRMQLLGLAGDTELGRDGRMELAKSLDLRMRAGLLLQGSFHDVTYWEIRSDERDFTVPGDLQLWQLGAFGRWALTDGPWQPTLRAEAGAAHWRCPMDADAWRHDSEANGISSPLSATGPWATVGAELGLELSAGGPRIAMALDGGYLQAGGASGPIAGGWIVLGTGL